MTIRKLVISAILLIASVAAVSAQEVIVPAGYDLVDSLVYKPAAAVDSALMGKNVFSLLPSKSRGGRADVVVHQSDALAAAMAKTIASNSSRSISG